MTYHSQLTQGSSHLGGMEDRRYPREAVSLSVELWRDHINLGRFKTRDIGTEGIFVETGPIDLHPYDFVTVILGPHRGGRRKREVMGLVVHRSNEGVGLMCQAENLGLHRALAPVPDDATA